MASPAVERMKEAMFTGLDYAAMPGDYLRGAIGNAVNRVKGGPRLKNRLTGREMLEGIGLLDPNQEGLDVGDVAGFGADLLLDPINLALGGLGAMTGLGRGAIKGARTLSGLASAASRAESLAGAKAALGAMPGAAMKMLPAAGVLGGTMASAYGGSALMGSNEEGSDLQDLLGMGMIAAPFMLPLGMAARSKWSKKSLAKAVAAEEAKAPMQMPASGYEMLPPRVLPDLPERRGRSLSQKTLPFAKDIRLQPNASEVIESTKISGGKEFRGLKIGDREAFASKYPEIKEIADRLGVDVVPYTGGTKGTPQGFVVPANPRLAFVSEDISRDELGKIGTMLHEITHTSQGHMGTDVIPTRTRDLYRNVREIMEDNPDALKSAGKRYSRYGESVSPVEMEAQLIGELTKPHLRDDPYNLPLFAGKYEVMEPKTGKTVGIVDTEAEAIAATKGKRSLDWDGPIGKEQGLSPEEEIRVGLDRITREPTPKYEDMLFNVIRERAKAQGIADPDYYAENVIEWLRGGEARQSQYVNRPQQLTIEPESPMQSPAKWSKKSLAKFIAAEDAKAAMQATPALQPPLAGPHGVLPIAREEIDFLEQLGIRDATKWQEIKRMLGGADARTPEAQAVVEKFLPQRGTPVFHGSHSDIQEFVPRQVKSYNSLGTWFTGSEEKASSLYGPKVYQSSVPENARLLEFGADQTDFLKVLGANADIAKKTGHLDEAKSLLKQLPDFEAEKLYDRRLRDEGWSQQLDAEFPGIKQIKKSNAAANSLLKSEKYMTEFRKMVESAGYDGIVWRQSNIDLSSGDTPHDVYVMFNKSSMPARKK